MLVLLTGLFLLLVLHSLRGFAPTLRLAWMERLGRVLWILLYSLASLVALFMVSWGYEDTRLAPVVLWYPPVWTRHLAALLMLPAFVFLAAALVPGTRIKARLGYPFLLAVKTWALAHLLANGNLGDVTLFGVFLAWAVAMFVVSRRRDRAQGVVAPAGDIRRDMIAVPLGLAGWAAFAFVAHVHLVGVAPFGG